MNTKYTKHNQYLDEILLIILSCLACDHLKTFKRKQI